MGLGLDPWIEGNGLQIFLQLLMFEADMVLNPPMGITGENAVDTE